MYLQDLRSKNPPVEITTGKDFLYGADFFQGKLYITTNEDAPHYRVFVADASNAKRENWKELIPQSDAVLQGARVTGGKLFAHYEHNVASELKVFSLDGKKLADIPMPAIGNVFSTTGRYDRNEIFFGFQSFTVPPSIYRYDLASGTSSLWTKVDAPSIDPSAYDVRQEWYHSKDGTRVPMFIVSKKGLVKNGKNPALLTAYGGFNISLSPTFSRSAYLWMEHGGVYAVANLRGGSEFGEDWHRAGMLEKKQNVFDDFIAAAEYLIAQKYTDKDHLAIFGGSNGGLLMGAMITQRPDLFRAVVCAVPLLDMLRYQNFQIAKLWIPEYGSADDPKQFNWLYAYSPYHHVKPGQEYPSILFMTADTDTRVDPMHAKEDDCAHASRSEERRQQRKANPAPHRHQSRPRPGQTRSQAGRGEHGYVLVSVLAVGRDTVIILFLPFSMKGGSLHRLMRLHVSPQNGVDAGLIAALLPEPAQQIRIQPHGHDLLRRRHNYLSAFPELFISGMNIRIRLNSLADAARVPTPQSVPISPTIGPGFRPLRF